MIKNGYRRLCAVNVTDLGLGLTAAPARSPMTQSYHGNTLGALAVGGNAWRRKLFAPLLIDTHRVSPRSENRGKRADATPLPIC